MYSLSPLVVVGLGLAVSAMSDIFDSKNYAEANVIVSDIAVIGGGSSGTYAAINLRKMGQNVVVVEKRKHLGGHTNTYTDHATGLTVDYGVQRYLNNSVTLDYFAHFNIPLVNYTEPNLIHSLADFNTGNPVAFNPSKNLTGWAIELAKYPWLDSTWNVPQPLAPDLLLPFGDFINKYNLSEVAFSVYLNAHGLSNPLQQLTVNVMKLVSTEFLSQISGAGVGPAHHDNSELYKKALSELGSNALVSSAVTAAARPQSGRGVPLVVKTPTGSKLIQASKLLITIPTTLENMERFDLSPAERALFAQWDTMGFYIMLVNNTGLPDGHQWINGDSSAMYNIPQQPAVELITSTRIPGMFYVWFRSSSRMARLAVEKAAIRAIQNIQSAQSFTVTTPQIVKFKSHSPFKLEVSAQAIKDGFYSDLYALQGQRNTWYTGAAMISHNGGVLWSFTQALLPHIIAADYIWC
ncbi:hypothetical protein N7457_005523 [Penicillium paradoxum]|uniref:uncharacterized protein n=1 Tax=Penicillium paradoxum TaxID=176176 RepID=UPI002548B9D8|nr:uncharacterized protein N7457_005523 [Penicillium paradoxum]KAJ5780363.1 hypothetical protein N7457_005523 [Penicillium paradoxum]